MRPPFYLLALIVACNSASEQPASMNIAENGGALSAQGGRADAGGAPAAGAEAATPEGGRAGAVSRSGAASTTGGGGSEAAVGGSGGTETAAGGREGSAGADAAGGTGGVPPATGGSTAIDSLFMLGADISTVQEEEDKGILFIDNGTAKGILQLLQDHGFNAIRLRLFHDPAALGGYQSEFVTRAEPYCDLPHTIEMAKRVKAASMRLLLDIHYSDTWADPNNQKKPAAWAGLSFRELVTEVYNYTRDTMLAMRAAGALPDIVQVGNEITPGMLHPEGRTFEPNNWDQLAQLLNAGLVAVKEVSPTTKTMLHLDRGGDNATTVWWVDAALARNVRFDILGLSAYTAFHGDASMWQANLADLAARYPKLTFVIAEYNGEKRAANDIIHDLPDKRGLGTFFWEPTLNGEWGDGMVTWEGSNAVFKPADLAIYDKIADDYSSR